MLKLIMSCMLYVYDLRVIRYHLLQMDEVEFEAVSVLKISKIKIGHDNAGYNPGWFLNKVIVKQDGAPEFDTEFICDR